MKVTLYTAKYCPYSLRARIALAEKRMNVDVVEASDLSADILKKISPKGTLPVLKEKDYSVDNKKALMIYIDERFPAPNLLPSIVHDRIKVRLALEKIDAEWYTVLAEVKKNRGNKVKLKNIFQDLEDSFKSMEGVFAESEFFISSTFTLADCYIAAMMLYLEAEGFIIDESYGAIFDYKKRIFARESIKKAYFKGNANDSLLKTLRASMTR
ncbi:glutathione S-transferase family protein [Francisella frigiditurris]|uniref:Glutaredoxin family protein n=1 Tax=Francisella frigiditurris TaxID=1542390 RepID=A0A1J0KT18_9GAMM|nr:glutathione S-transferase N-terminal domain-containing protein [Francisella frigiditurris]APC96842.1 hypothetical protein KX01_1024 [Francisella frigiditurris]